MDNVLTNICRYRNFYWYYRFLLCIVLVVCSTFPVIAQAEVKTILKSSGERYKRLRESGESLVGTGTDERTSKPVEFNSKLLRTECITSNNEEKLNTFFEGIGKFDADKQTADDLKVINGIGPKMEEVLNSIGIYTYLQVSKMTKKEYDLLDSITGSFPGRAERDDWAGQAKKLLNN
jgi:hypothetical protein